MASEGITLGRYFDEPAARVVNGKYARDRVITTFTAIYPADKPKYLERRAALPAALLPM